MDTSKLRENDVPYVNEVVGYLTQRQLDVELAGSALNGERTYQDVDLLARGNLEAVTNATSGLMGLDARTEPFPEKSADGLEYQVQHVGGPTMYVNNQVDERFDIQVGNTKIDLCLKVNK